MFNLADRMNTIQPSPTLVLNAKAGELRAQGIDIINLSTGEPDFDTPTWIQEAAIKAMQKGVTKYTPGDGLPALKAAIQTKLLRDYDLDYDLNMITVGAGGKQVIFNAFMASVNPGDEVIIPAPYWVSYPEIVSFCGGVPILVPCHSEDNFKLTAEQLRYHITDRTRWLILNSPNNPTGVV
jgi:aspartate aminotransferase